MRFSEPDRRIQPNAPILYTREQKNKIVENTLADSLALLLLTPPRFPMADIDCLSALGGLVIFSRLCVYVAFLGKVVVFVVLETTLDRKCLRRSSRTADPEGVTPFLDVAYV